VIICNNCGFGHKTFEELKACKPWSQIVAEAKERGEYPLGNALPKAQTSTPNSEPEKK